VWISCQYKRSDCHFMLAKFSCSQVAVMARMSSIIVWMWICQQKYDSLNVSVTAARVLFSVCHSNFYRSRQLHIAVQIRAYNMTSLGSCHISLNIIATCLCVIGHVVQFTLMVKTVILVFQPSLTINFFYLWFIKKGMFVDLLSYILYWKIQNFDVCFKLVTG